MIRGMHTRFTTLVLVAVIIFQPAMLWAGDNKEEINALAEEDMKQLEEGVINVEKFIGEPWYKRHMGKLVAGAVIVIGGVAIVCSGGVAAPAVGTGAAHFVAGTGTAGAGEVAASLVSGAFAGAAYIDSKGNIEIPEEKKLAARDFYRDNYSSWVNQSSTKKEFGETALREIVQYLERNK